VHSHPAPPHCCDTVAQSAPRDVLCAQFAEELGQRLANPGTTSKFASSLKDLHHSVAHAEPHAQYATVTANMVGMREGVGQQGRSAAGRMLDATCSLVCDIELAKADQEGGDIAAQLSSTQQPAADPVWVAMRGAQSGAQSLLLARR